MGDRTEDNTMTDQQSTTPPADDDAPNRKAPGADETFGWTADDAAAGGEANAGNTAERMIAQLQSMIDSIATQAAPVVRQVGIKAAELAAAAADRAGPIAHKAANATADASVKVAERSRTLAADLRREVAGTNGGSATAELRTDIAADLRDETAKGEGDTSGAVDAVLDGVDDASEQAAKDDPAEGSR
jgi:hypothetical protein